MDEKTISRQKGDVAVTEAKRAARRTIFHRPDYEKAASYYREATKQYRMAGEESKLLSALKASAQAHSEIRSLHQAATDLHKAAEITAKDAKNRTEAAHVYQEAASYYRANDNPDTACDMLIKAARCLVGSASSGVVQEGKDKDKDGKDKEYNQDDADADAALALCDEAIQIVEEQGRIVTCYRKIQQCISIALGAGRYSTAVSFLKRQNQLYQDKDNQSLFRNYLQLLVVYFAMRDYRTADVEFAVWQSDEKFCRSDYWEPGAKLLAAYESRSAEALADALKSSAFKYLSNPIARLASTLRFSDHVLAERKSGSQTANATEAAARLT